jgi:hypothetical protein
VAPPPRNKQAQNMRGRIRNLESLVVNLISQKEQDQKTVGAEPPEEPKAEELNPDTFGQLHISNSGNETHYVGAYHWSSLLKEIEEVKMGLEDEEEQWDHAASARSSITFGMPLPISKAQLIDEMPPKEEVDRLLPLWFNR